MTEAPIEWHPDADFFRVVCRLGALLPDGLDADALIARMRLDKKADAHGLRLVLWDGIGRGRLVAGVDDANIRVVLG